jgi:hypothetical protein
VADAPPVSRLDSFDGLTTHAREQVADALPLLGIQAREARGFVLWALSATQKPTTCIGELLAGGLTEKSSKSMELRVQCL